MGATDVAEPASVRRAGGIRPNAGRRSRRRRLGRIATAGVVALAVAWGVIGTRPALADTGVFWAEPAFVERPAENDAPDGVPAGGDETWVAWDTEDGAWASVLLRSTRPYPITLTVVEQGLVTETRVAGYDRWPDVELRPGSVRGTERLEVPAHGMVVVLLRVSDRCLEMTAGSSTGTGTATLEVTNLGLTSQVAIAFPTTYMVGHTQDHVPAPGCPG